ncbi:MAG: hypothetical protein GY828_00420 [Candidatus Gracilibacteria bacterium]|nr:hypothetical protein [Candidatus Gracilibacteria bacterium]
MKKNIQATSIVEAMVVLLIVTLAVTGAYNVFSRTIKLTDSNEYKLVAISMAKEGIEAFTNIRDTNWKVLPGDYTNCWNTLNYDISCFNATPPKTSTDIGHDSSYTIYRNSTNYRWYLQNFFPTGGYSNSTYRENFRVWYDNDGFFTQTGTIIQMKPVFTREIKVSYIEDGLVSGFTDSNEQKMKVTSLVQWTDPSSTKVKKVELETILTNWKNK